MPSGREFHQVVASAEMALAVVKDSQLSLGTTSKFLSFEHTALLGVYQGGSPKSTLVLEH